MRYLFFDIECANCFQGKGKICSFGYVLTDYNFIVLEREDLIINPRSRFYLVGRGGAPDLELAYPQSTFRRAPAFPEFYERIRALLTDPENLVFGHATRNDVGFVRSECERYGLPQLDYTFYDSQRIYQEMHGLKTQVSLERIVLELDLDMQHVHKSVDDAEMTMRVVQKLCAKLGLTLEELVARYPTSRGEIKNGQIHQQGDAERENRMTRGNRNRFLQFLADGKPEAEISSPLSGKRISLHAGYERAHFRQMVLLVHAMKRCGARYVLSATKADVFVCCGGDAPCEREAAARASFEKKGRPVLMTMPELLAALKLKPRALEGEIDVEGLLGESGKDTPSTLQSVG